MGNFLTIDREGFGMRSIPNLTPFPSLRMRLIQAWIVTIAKHGARFSTCWIMDSAATVPSLYSPGRPWWVGHALKWLEVSLTFLKCLQMSLGLLLELEFPFRIVPISTYLMRAGVGHYAMMASNGASVVRELAPISSLFVLFFYVAPHHRQLFLNQFQKVISYFLSLEINRINEIMWLHFLNKF